MTTYNFKLKDNKEKPYRQFVWFLFSLHLVAAGIFALNASENVVKLSLSILMGFYVIIAAVYYLVRTRKNALETASLILALLYANFWFSHVGIIALLIFAAIFLFVTAVQGKKTAIQIAETGVHLTRVFKTVIFPWSEMDNVILKDNLLTIDFKTNKIIQVEVVETAPAIDEVEFNNFCNGHIQSPA